MSRKKLNYFFESAAHLFDYCLNLFSQQHKFGNGILLAFEPVLRSVGNVQKSHHHAVQAIIGMIDFR